MTNKESLQNIEVVKKLAHLYNNDSVYLKFKNKTVFEIIRHADHDEDFHDLILDNLHLHKLPYAHMWHPPLRSEPHLLYKDENLSYFLNLTTKQYTIEFHDAPADVDGAREEYLELIRQFK